MTKGISAAKRHRQSVRRRDVNRHRVRTLRTLMRSAREAATEGTADREERVRVASAALDRAASHGVVHANNASRRKGRLRKLLNRGDSAG